MNLGSPIGNFPPGNTGNTLPVNSQGTPPLIQTPLPDTPQGSNSAPSWLQDLLCPSSSTAAPLSLAAALPPIPAKVVEKIAKGQFVDFKELLPDNVALLAQLKEMGPGASLQSKSRLRDISDPSTWAQCYMGFVAASTPDKNIRDLMAYGQIILHLARAHAGPGWLAYDRRFRQQRAAGLPLLWTEIDASLMSATVLSMSQGRAQPCPLCWAWDHERSECALLALHPQPQEPPRPSKARPRPYPVKVPEPCRRFNNGICPNSAERCTYTHCCDNCLKVGHVAKDCKDPKKGKGSLALS